MVREIISNDYNTTSPQSPLRVATRYIYDCSHLHILRHNAMMYGGKTNSSMYEWLGNVE